MSQLVNVSVGVIHNQLGEILVAQRMPYEVWGECWEFPGGKVEPKELFEDALVRELQEEIGIQATQFYPWLSIPYLTNDKLIKLHVFQVLSFEGIPQGLEGQAIQWINPKALLKLPFPIPNVPILQALID